VVVQEWNASYDGPDVLSGSWELEDGDLIVLGTGGSSAGVERGYRIASLAFDVEVSNLPLGFSDWAIGYGVSSGPEGDDDEDDERNIQEFYFGGTRPMRWCKGIFQGWSG
jgi:hypothetical protein